MTHKESCKEACTDYLQNLCLSHIFNMSDFNHFYRKFDGANANAYMFGLNIGDFIIKQESTKLKKIETKFENKKILEYGTLN